MGKKRRILVVDDEESIRNLLQRFLTKAGYSVATAANGKEALDEVSQAETEVVLLDIKMPGISGIEVLQQLTTNYPNICVIMATAVGDTRIAVETMKLGAYDYITKPFDWDDMILKLQRAIEKKELLLENEHYRLNLEKKVREQTERLQQQFAELVNTLAREHKLIYNLASSQPKGSKSLFSGLPLELQQPMSSSEEFSDALLRILRRGTKTAFRASTDSDKDSKR